jgi:hypothetical protein
MHSVLIIEGKYLIYMNILFSYFPMLMRRVAALETLWRHVWIGFRDKEHMSTVQI